MTEITHWITFDKDRYHEYGRMEYWCSKHFGPGNWVSEREIKDWTDMQVNWTIHSMFGRTTFSFKHPTHLTLFALRWV